MNTTSAASSGAPGGHGHGGYFARGGGVFSSTSDQASTPTWTNECSGDESAFRQATDV